MSVTRTSAARTPKILPVKHQHIANRFSFGVSESLADDVRHYGTANRWLERQMRWSTLSDSRGDAVVGWFPHLKDSPGKAWANVKAETRSGWDYGFDLVSFTLAKKIVGRRQVHEVMTDFWSNLLYIPAYEDRSFPWRFHYDSTIRSNALGSFRMLLRRTVVHPAMSGWLNNSSNTKRGINENLGRELLELFTVGRPAGYDEDDVQDSARLLTGFKVKVFDGYDASYSTADHYVGPVKILGFTHQNSSADGRAAVNAYLDYLARHPATAKRIASRLCVRFVSDTPSASVVNAVARSYLRHDTDIKATLRTLVAHPDFLAARRKKVRTPTEDVLNAARLLGMRPSGSDGSDSVFARQLNWMATGVGQGQFGWPRPDGFPETSTTWASPARVLRSWNSHYMLAGNWWASSHIKIAAKKDLLPTSFPRTLGQLVDHQSRMLLGRPATRELRDAVATATGRSDSSSFATRNDVSDWVWTLIRGAVLNAPEGMLR